MNSFNPLKLIVVFVIAAFGLIGFWFAFKTNFASPLTHQEAQQSKTNFPEGNKINNPFLNLNLDLAKIKEFVNQNNSTSSMARNQNLTEEIAKTMAAKILTANENLLNYKSGEALSSEQIQISNELINKLKNQNYLSLNQEIDEKTFKIDSTNSIFIKKQYIAAIEDINHKCFAGFHKDIPEIFKDLEKNDNSSAKNLAQVYNCAYNELENRTVPLNWVDLHKNLLNYYQNAKIIYEALSNFQEDPLKAWLASNAISELIETANKIQDILEIKAKSIGL